MLEDIPCRVELDLETINTIKYAAGRLMPQTWRTGRKLTAMHDDLRSSRGGGPGPIRNKIVATFREGELEEIRDLLGTMLHHSAASTGDKRQASKALQKINRTVRHRKTIAPAIVKLANGNEILVKADGTVIFL